ncbi:hypothetical protein RA25_13740 [Leisingera sp. ANG-S5]|nr:hypothetical protein RA25_13740 [Leisingera sp. ANG-S5]
MLGFSTDFLRRMDAEAEVHESDDDAPECLHDLVFLSITQRRIIKIGLILRRIDLQTWLSRRI